MNARWGLLLLGFCLLAVACSPAPPDKATAAGAESSVTDGGGTDDYVAARQGMVAVVRDWGVADERVLAALGRVPRHEFVPIEYQDQAYANHPLPIGFGQTISQPYIVGLMTEQLAVEAGDRVLEVGTGSGYQAAVVAELDTQVYSIEIIDALAQRAKATLGDLGYDNIELRHADGYYGWPEQGPFDGILVTAAPDHIPQPLIEQLTIGGVMVIPVGPPGGYQELWRITRVSPDETERVSLGGVRFVPLTRQKDDGG